MKLIRAAALCVVALSGATQAAAAELHGTSSTLEQQRGAFAGVRLRMPIGSSSATPHAGLALTTVRRSDGSSDLRFASGVELGFAGDEKIRLSLAGRSADRLLTNIAPDGRTAPEGKKLGVSTVGWVAIGVTVTVVVGGLLLLKAARDASD